MLISLNKAPLVLVQALLAKDILGNILQIHSLHFLRLLMIPNCLIGLGCSFYIIL